MPREGLKPSAVVEEGGKLRARETPLERAGWGLESGPPTRGPPHPLKPGPACTCSELAKRAWLHSLAALGEGLCSQALRAHFICLPRFGPHWT